jgi:hypothetical protein
VPTTIRSRRFFMAGQTISFVLDRIWRRITRSGYVGTPA